MDIYDHIFADSSKTPDEKADEIINAMVAAAAGAAVIPAHVNWALFASVLGGGVVAIGNVYGIALDGDEAWKLVKQFFMAAGFTFLALTVGAKIIAAILTMTGVGYFPAAAMDAAVSSAIAYAVGKTGQAYFKGDSDKASMRKNFVAAMRHAQNKAG